MGEYGRIWVTYAIYACLFSRDVFLFEIFDPPEARFQSGIQGKHPETHPETHVSLKDVFFFRNTDHEFFLSILVYGTMSFSLVGNVAGGIWWGRGTRGIKRLKHATPGPRLEENTGLTRNTDVEKHH